VIRVKVCAELAQNQRWHTRIPPAEAVVGIWPRKYLGKVIWPVDDPGHQSHF
jgi:hypothetical protein